jgi:hypothetical protein
MKLGVSDLRYDLGINGAPDVKQLKESCSSLECIGSLPGKRSVSIPPVHVFNSYLEALLARTALSARWKVSKPNCST